MKKIFLAIILLVALGSSVFAQLRTSRGVTSSPQSDDLSYLSPKEYVIGGVNINGVKYLDPSVLLTISKLAEGERILVPGDATSSAIKNLWEQHLFEDVELAVARISGDTIYFDLNVVEIPRVSRIVLKGMTKTETTEVQEKLDKQKSKVVNENLNKTIKAIVNKHFYEKGYLNTEIDISLQADSSDANSRIVNVVVDKNKKVKVHAITIEGNEVFSDARLKKFMKKPKEQKWYRIFGPGKFVQDKYEEGKDKMVAKMREKGYREAVILSDTIYKHSSKTINIDLKVHEGPKYYFGDINFVGNAKYPESVLKQILRIEKGEVFSEEKLDKTLRGNGPSGNDVSTLYLDDGYLTFNVDPVQTKIYNDTVDLEIRIFEGPQYNINNIILKGNDITNDKVVLRELETKPGQKFSKSALIRSQRQITQLGNFDETKLGVNPVNINPNEGTVDIEYSVAEKPSDQIELSGGFGGGRVIGTLGLTFNNFSARNLFNLKAYKPLPKGDGQKLSIRGQTNGKYYQSYSFSFSEPWLGGKKPIYFGISAFTSLQSNGLSRNNPNLQKIRLNGLTFTLGKRLKWPDNYFRVDYSANLQQFRLNNYAGYLFENGDSYDLSLSQVFSRNSVDAPIFPTSGSNIKFTVQATLPYSSFNGKNYDNLSTSEKYKFAEYHKWKFETQFYQKVVGKWVLKAQAQFGFIGYYNKSVGQAPFGRFKVGGDGLQGFDFLQGSEVIGLRGYSNNSVIPEGAITTAGSPIFNKYIMELRYPITITESAQVFGLVFAEGGNTWNRFADFNPFNVKRSVGIGARIFLPIFGLLGVDYGYGFDSIPGNPDANKGQFHFSIAQQMGGF